MTKKFLFLVFDLIVPSKTWIFRVPRVFGFRNVFYEKCISTMKNCCYLHVACVLIFIPQARAHRGNAITLQVRNLHGVRVNYQI